LDELLQRIGSRFARVEPRRPVRSFVLGLLAGLPRVNCWTIAEHAGEASPDGMQHLLARAAWDAEAVRDDLRGYLVDHLADPGAVLVVDETGDLKNRMPRATARYGRPCRREVWPCQCCGPEPAPSRVENSSEVIFRMPGLLSLVVATVPGP
jgi:hypothetical protein